MDHEFHVDILRSTFGFDVFIDERHRIRGRRQVLSVDVIQHLYFVFRHGGGWINSKSDSNG